MSTRLEDYDNAPETEGTVICEKKWYLALMPQDVHDLMLENLKKQGEICKPSKRSHISIMKNEVPSQNSEEWGTAFVGEKVKVKYSKTIRNDNGFHFWIDCYSPRLCEMREYFSLPTLKVEETGIYLVNFHMTIGRREEGITPNIRPRLRLFPQSHIDIETGMQHL